MSFTQFHLPDVNDDAGLWRELFFKTLCTGSLHSRGLQQTPSLPRLIDCESLGFITLFVHLLE